MIMGICKAIIRAWGVTNDAGLLQRRRILELASWLCGGRFISR